MARPIKNNADYFPHDADMRNDAKVKALRRKFGMMGYAIYCMLIEFLTDSDFFQFKNDNIGVELISGDFDCTPEDLKSVLEYCIQLDLLQTSKTGHVRCKSLEKRLDGLLSKRKRDRKWVIDNESTQSKVKESKVKKSKVNNINAFVSSEEFFSDKPEAFNDLKVDDLYIEECQRLLSGKGWVSDPMDIVALLQNFINGKCNITEPKKSIRQHFKNWLFATENEKLITLSTVFKNGLNRKSA